MYSEQVQKYFDVFGREQVHVIIFDDFVRDTAAVYRVSDLRNFDHDVDGNEVAVTAQVLTPRYFTDGSWTHWN